MVTVIDFVVQLLAGIVDLARITVFDVLLGVDPITAVSALVGSVLLAVSIGIFAYLALGALVNQLTGLGSSAPDATPGRIRR